MRWCIWIKILDILSYAVNSNKERNEEKLSGLAKTMVMFWFESALP